MFDNEEHRAKILEMLSNIVAIVNDLKENPLAISEEQLTELEYDLDLLDLFSQDMKRKIDDNKRRTN